MGEDLVLGAQREAGEEVFEGAEGGKGFGEDEEEMGGEDFEAGVAEAAAGFAGGEGDGVFVEGDAGHDEACAGVPGVVFPQREEPPRQEGIPNATHGGGPLRWWNVVEDPITIHNVAGWARLVLIQRLELRPVRAVLAPCGVNRFGRHIDSQREAGAKNIKKEGGGGTGPTPIIHDPPRTLG